LPCSIIAVPGLAQRHPTSLAAGITDGKAQTKAQIGILTEATGPRHAPVGICALSRA
jgi:hypothetical protein